MATTRLMPLHTGKGRTVGQAISDIIDYTENPQKTDGGRLITSRQCDSRIADAEFLFTKNQYIQKTARVRGEDDVIVYHLRQSFVPGEITIHKAAKSYFDGLRLKKLPTIKALNTEYAELLSDKKAAYADYRKAREEMKELLTAKANIDRILELDKEQEEANERREKETEQR